MFHASHKVMERLFVNFLTHQLTSHTHQPSPATPSPLPSHLAFEVHLKGHFPCFGNGGLFIRGGVLRTIIEYQQESGKIVSYPRYDRTFQSRGMGKHRALCKTKGRTV